MEFIHTELIISLAIILTAFFGFITKKIYLSAAITGAGIAFLLWFGGGRESLFVLFLFFVFGTLATSWKKEVKSRRKLEQENHGKRGISNVSANAGVATVLSVLALALPQHQAALKLMIIASFATACSDTFSSEFGIVYGKKFVNIINLKSVNRGTDGGISLQGLFFGLFGSMIITISMFFFYYDYQTVIMITLCGLIGNLIDSILGATLQRKGKLNNHQVNLFATLSGALLALAYTLIMN